MIDNPEISVIIPVYNSEPWLKECLDSLTVQTFNNFEIICVNDASEDRSSEIIEKYASLDNRIQVIKLTENQGAMMARIHGISASRGNYLFFCDADDTLPVNSLNLLIYKAKNYECDIISGDITLVRQDGRIFLKKRSHIGDNSLSYLRAILTGTTCSLSGSLFRRELFDKSGEVFLPKCNYSEDRILLTHILTRINCTVLYLSESTYNYRINLSSSTRRGLTKSDLQSQLKSLWMCYDIIDSLIKDKSIKKLNNYFICRTVGYLIECGYDIENVAGDDLRTRQLFKCGYLIHVLGVRLGLHVYLCKKSRAYRKLSHLSRCIIRRYQGKE